MIFDVKNPMKVSSDQPRPKRALGLVDGREEALQLTGRTDSGGARTQARLAEHGHQRTTRGMPSKHRESRRLGARRRCARAHGRRRTLEGNKAHGRIGRFNIGNDVGRYGLVGGERP